MTSEPFVARLRQWEVIAALGFAFDSYELLMLPLIVRPALLGPAVGLHAGEGADQRRLPRPGRSEQHDALDPIGGGMSGRRWSAGSMVSSR